MKIYCGPGPETREKQRDERARQKWRRITQWHSHFAWLPVRISDTDCRWLETIERKYGYAYLNGHSVRCSDVQYRVPEEG